MFGRYRAFERLFVANFNTPPGNPDPTKEPPPAGGAGGGAKPDELQSLKDQLAALQKEKSEWEKKKEDDLGLGDKVTKERLEKDKKTGETKNLESALTFNLTSADFLKANESVLPKDIGDIFKAADKETYDGAVQKANATKAAIIQSFFSQQSNVDYLTETQKLALADYLKLTKNGKEERSKDIYENLFEPALSTLKRVKKAEELGREKFGGLKEGDGEYRDRLMALSKKHFLGEKV